MVMKGDCVRKLPAYAFIAYESADAEDSAETVLYFADSICELARRMHVSRNYIYKALKAHEQNQTYNKHRPYDIRRVSLN